MNCLSDWQGSRALEMAHAARLGPHGLGQPPQALEGSLGCPQWRSEINTTRGRGWGKTGCLRGTKMNLTTAGASRQQGRSEYSASVGREEGRRPTPGWTGRSFQVGHQGIKGSWGKDWTAGRSRYICPRHRWGKTGERGDCDNTWSVARVPHREAGALHFGERQPVSFRSCWPGDGCYVLDLARVMSPQKQPFSMSSSQKCPLSQEQDVRLRELLWPEERRCPAPGPPCPSLTRGSSYRWGAGERAKSLQPPPQKAFPPVEVGAGPVIH